MIQRISIAALTLCAALFAQAPARVVGVVTAADPAARTLTVKADDGSSKQVKVAEAAKISQLAPGQTSLADAKPAKLASVAAGDRVLARGPESNGVIEANLVVLMSKTDLAKRDQQEQMTWATKGIAGVVTAVDKSANAVTLNVRGPEGVKPVAVSLAPNASVKRYAEGSTKYADAKNSSLAEVEVGDQVRALGDRSADGASYTAKQVITGAFRNLAVTVISVDAASGTLEVVDLDTKKKLQVKVPEGTSLRRMPEMMARGMAMMMNGTGNMGGMGQGGGMGMGMRPQGAPPQGAPSQGGPQGAPQGGMRPGAPGMAGGGMGGPGMGGPGMAGGMGGGMRRGGGDLSQMLERLPALQLSELKKDEPLILSVSKTSDPAKAIAITVLAGVEPILATPTNGSRAMMLGTWNLDGGGGMMGGGMGTP